MDKQQHIHELIDQYLMGELVGQELDKFKIRLKDDPAFLNQVQIQKAIINSVEIARRDELKAILVDATKPKKGFIIPFGNRSLAVAASILSLLAFGLIIKTMLPQGGEELSQADKTEQTIIKEPIENQKPVSDSAQVVATLDDENQDSLFIPPSPEIALADVVEDDETMDDASILTAESDDVDFAELKKNEDEIDGDEFKAQRDSMLGSKNVVLLAVAYETQASEATTSQEVKTAKKDGLFNRKSKEKSDKKTEVAESAPQKTLKTSPSIGIRVEFWESIVKFKGYKFDGKKLLLFDTPVSTQIGLKSYGNTTFLNKGGTWYKIVPNNSFNQMVRVSNTEILKVLNAK